MDAHLFFFLTCERRCVRLTPIGHRHNCGMHICVKACTSRIALLPSKSRKKKTSVSSFFPLLPLLTFSIN